MQRPVDDPPTRVIKATLQWFCTRCGSAALGTPQEYDEWRKAHVCDPTIRPAD